MWNRVHQRLLQESLRRVLRTTACALVRIRHAMQRGVLLIALAGFVMSNNTAPGPGQQSTQSPDQETLPLGWSQLTAYLSQVYAAARGQVADSLEILVPKAGALASPAKIAIQLLHFREASMDRELASPQQYGLWEVQGLGLVVAFRGTASPQDIMIDVNIAPEPLAGAFSPGQASFSVHSGFYEGARKHAENIVSLVRLQQRRRGHSLPVWVTGHSLGGGYANCLILHLLAQQQGAHLFSAGGGAVTFGAPQVLYSEDASALYEALSSLESRGWSADGSSRPADAQLHFHNFVNNADVVPRLLGSSLDSVHDRIQQYVASMQRVRSISQHYHPFGGYHLIVGTQVRTPPPEHVAPGGVAGHMGNTAYAEVIRKYLHISVLWKTVYATTARGGGVLHHSLTSYIANLRSHTEAIAARVPAAPLHAQTRPHDLFASRPGLGESPMQSPGRQERGVTGPAGSGTASPSSAPSQEFLDELGGLIGHAGKLLIDQAAQSGWSSAGSLGSSAAEHWRTYWNKAPHVSTEQAAAEAETSDASAGGALNRATAREQARQNNEGRDTKEAHQQSSSLDSAPAGPSWGDYLTWSYWKGGAAGDSSNSAEL